MNREILKAKIAEVISSTNKSGNEKLEAILAVVDAYSSADNGAKPIVSGSNSVDYEVECNECGWHGNKEDLEQTEEDDEIDTCPGCGSESLYYFR